MNKHPAILRDAFLILALFLSVPGGRIQAGSATWNLNPGSDIWNTATNWTPATVPNGAPDTATFGVSNTTSIFLTANTEVNGIVFNAGGYTINVSGPPATAPTLIISGAGITNAGTFVTTGGRLKFQGGATAGPATIVIPAGDPVINPGELLFLNTATAGSSVITIAGSTANGGFADAFFANNSSGGSSTITTGGSSGRVNDLGGMVNFLDNATAANATLIVNGGTTPGALGGFQFFSGSASAGAATLIANGGTGGGDGGRTFFADQSDGGTARAITNAGGIFDTHLLTNAGMSIGSIEGAGTYQLGSANLTVGTNNLSTEVSGSIKDGSDFAPTNGTGASLTKVGTGTLTLSGANSYTGATTVNAGKLIVASSLNAASAVSVASGGTLGGAGSVNGAVTIKDGGILAPGAAGSPGTFTLGSLVLNPTSNLNFRLGAPGVVGGASNDLIAVTGGLTLDGILNVTNSASFGLGTYRLINFGGALTNNGLGIGTTPAGFSASDLTIQTSVANQVNLIVGASSSLLFWDGAQTVSNNVVNGGSGDWNTTRTNWTTASGATNSAWGNQFAVFSGAAGGAVALKESVSTTGMQFATAGYTIDADPGQSITLTGATTFRVDPGIAATVNAPLIGGGSLTKTDAGALTLGGANTYAGATTVGAGALLVNGSLASGPLSVSTAATLGGTGTISGAVTIANGGKLAPGAGGVGTITVGSLILNGTSNLNYDLGAPNVVGGVTNDLLHVSGALTLDGVLNIADAGGFGFGSYRLIDYGGALTNNSLAVGTMPAGFTGDFVVQTSVAGQVNLVVSPTSGILFWDGPQVTANGLVDGGSSTWNNSRTNWTNVGGTTQRAWNGGMAVFTGAPGVVTVGENVTTTGLQFSTNGYVVNAAGGAAIALSGAAEVRVDSSKSATINARLTGGALSKTGTGTLTLTGANTYAGGTSIVDGVIVVSNAAGLGLGTGPVTVLASATGELRFVGTASAGNIIVTNSGGSTTDDPGLVSFLNTATAGTTVITNQGNTAAQGAGGFVTFENTSRAGSATINNLGARFSNPTAPGYTTAGGGQTSFRDTTTADTATITNFAGIASGLQGGQTLFTSSASAGTATIANRGGAVAGAIGGSTQFFNSTTASAATLIADGGTNGGLGGTIVFKNTSSGGTARVILNTGDNGNASLDFSGLTSGGTTLGSIEGAGTVFLGGKNIALGFNNLSTEFSGVIADGGIAGGIGGSFVKWGTGRLTLSGNNTYSGGTTVLIGEVAVRTPTGMGLGTGAVQVFSGTRLLFIDNALAGANTISVGPSTSNTSYGGRLVFLNAASAGSATIRQFGSTLSNVNTVANTSFFNNATAGSALITNFGGQANNSAHGGEIVFWDNSTAANATINNHGAEVAGANAAFVSFVGSSTAGAARITNFGTATKTAFGAGNGGGLSFGGQATAGTAMIVNQGATAGNGSSGTTSFLETSSANGASITNQGGTALFAPGGRTRFFGAATAGDSNILNAHGAAFFAYGGTTTFFDSASAGRSVVTNQGTSNLGGLFGVGGLTEFRNTSSASAGTFFNEAGVGASGGFTQFLDTAMAGTARFDNEGGGTASSSGGYVYFSASSSADRAVITNRGITVNTALGGGVASFDKNAKAGTATIANEGSAFSVGGGGAGVAGGSTLFGDSTSADHATITNRAPLALAGTAGLTKFTGVGANIPTAGNATITNEGGRFFFQYGGITDFTGTAVAGAAVFNNRAGQVNFGLSGFTYFHNSTKAGTATFTNEGAAIADAFGGVTAFYSTATADRAAILNRAATVAGAHGGTTQFNDTASAGQSVIHNEGSTVPGADNGYTQFDNSSSAGQATLYGDAGVGAAPGGSIIFRGTTSGGTARAILGSDGAGGGQSGLDISLLASAGMGIGSIEGSGIVSLGNKTLSVGTNNLDAEFSGLIRDGGFVNATGGRLTKVGTATLLLAGDSTYTGGTTVADGILRVTNVNGLGLGSGAVTVQATPTSELRYSLTSSAGAVSITNLGGATAFAAGTTTFRSSATAASAVIFDNGNLANGGLGGYTEFYATSRAGSATFQNLGSFFLGGAGGIGGGDMFFYENSTADAATIFNGGGFAFGAEGGQANFFGNSSAGTATITNFAANAGGAFQGATVFRGLATAGGATLQNLGSSNASMYAGVTAFLETATAGSAKLDNQGGGGAGGLGGQVTFVDSSKGGTATLTNRAATTASAVAGKTVFAASADAESSTGINEGGKFAFQIGGITEFRGLSKGGSGVSTNRAGQAASAYGGETNFYDSAKAGNRHFINEGGLASGYAGGMYFLGSSNAENATFTNQGSTVATANEGGVLLFQASSKAGNATISNDGSGVSNFPGAITLGGRTEFSGTASADHAAISNHPALQAAGSPGYTTFISGAATAGQATIFNEGGTAVNAFGGGTYFFSGATAGQATIVNRGGSPAGGTGGATGFSQNSTAGSATITAEGSDGFFGGGFVGFVDTSSAGSATLNANGATAAGGARGIVDFRGNATAATATLFARSGSVAGAPGGTLEILSNGSGGTARVVLEAGGSLDISGLFAANPGATIGSVEGAGNVLLGSKRLTVGGNNLSTVFDGVMQDGGLGGGVVGSLRKTGTGALTLGGANTFTGRTDILQGLLRVHGSLAGGAYVQNATLGGNGTIAGGVIVGPGGIVNPGASPGTLTVVGDFLQQSGGTLQMEIGGLNPSDTDHLIVTGKLTLGGILELDFINGFAPQTGAVFNLLTFATLAGQFTGVEVTGLAAGWQFTLDPTGTTLGLTSQSNAVSQPVFLVQSGANILLTGPGQFTPGDPLHFVGGTLEAATDAALDNPVILGLAGGIFQSDAGTASTLSGVLSGPGALTKTGPGALTLTAANTFTGDTFIADGALFVDGTLASANVFVLRNGLLGGTGTLFGNVFNSGIVSPGHSPGTLHIGGNFTQSAAGALRIEIGGRDAGQFDRLIIGGHASLDGTLQLVRLNNFKLKRGDRLEFLTADQGVSGKFATVLNSFTNGTILEPRVTYGPASVALELAQGSFAGFAGRAGLAPNLRAVAHALDRAAYDPRAAQLIAYLDDRLLEKLPGDFDKIAPEELTSVFTIGTSLAQVQAINVQRRTADLRSGSNGFSAAGLAMSGSAPNFSGGLGVTGPAGNDGKESKAVFAPAPDSRWGVFLTGVGEWVSIGDTHDAAGYDITTGGFTLGVDYKVCPGFAVGLSAGYAGTGADLSNQGRVWVNGGKLGLYATAYAGGFYADVAVTGGVNSYDTRRTALRGDARGSTDGSELNVLFATGYDWKKGALTIGPTASFQYTYVSLDGFTERGSLAPLAIRNGSGESLRTALGFKASYDWRVGRVLIKPELRAAWQHESGDGASDLTSRFANGAGGSFNVNGPQLGRDSALLGAGFAIQWSERLSTYLYYDGQLGRSHYDSHSISGGVRVEF